MTARQRGFGTLAFVLAAIVGLMVGVRGHAGEPGVGQQRTTVGVTHGPKVAGGAVYPMQRLPLRFDHSRHLARGMNCTDCHSDIGASTTSRTNDIPTGATCDGCHGQQHPRPRGEPARCSLCHTVSEGKKVGANVLIPPPRLHFNHQLHLQKGAKCETCHGDMTKVGLATVDQLPDESTCLSCHDGKQATNRCGACHPTDSSGRMMTRPFDDHVSPPLLPRGPNARGADHDLAFVEDHAGIAKANPSLCENCHAQRFCQDCHTGSVRPLRIHVADYLTTHAMDARGRTQDCQGCHRIQVDCRACHERLGLGQGDESSFGVGSPYRFHPSGWAGPLGTRQSHAFAAQRNIEACASCHDEDTCLSCHATTGARNPGLDVSPHGPAFASTGRCQALANRNRRVCLKCHAPGDRALDCVSL